MSADFHDRAAGGQDRAGVAETIKRLNREMIADWEREDAFDSWVARFADDEARREGLPLLVVIHTSYATPEEMEANFRPMLANRQTHVTMGDEYVAVLSEDAAVHFGQFTFTTTENRQTEGPFMAGATTIWVRKGGQWKILHYHQSWPSDSPVPAGAS
jgi:ketosteroid isomerase-like protein